ncbi:MAG: M48 family metallopeptidase [Nitrospinota bacterium]|nr:M48 family metallopeptidase [Nitrospinota bacterium]
MRLRAKSIFLLVFVAALWAPVAPAWAVSEGVEEEAIGRQYDQEIAITMGFYQDKKLSEYVERIGRKVLAQVHEPMFEFHFKVVDDAMVNAFALPGGYVYITRGMLATLNDEAELAGVLGHEIGHVIGHHSVKQMRKSIAQALLALGGIMLSPEIRSNAGAWITVTTTLGQQMISGYGREMEMESDQEGLILAYNAGYDPGAIVSFLSTMRNIEKLGFRTYHSFMASHPDTRDRITEAQVKSSLLQARGEKKERHRDRFMDNMEGLKYGKPRWKGETAPPFKIVIHKVVEGETFRSITRDVSGDVGQAFEIAAINGLEIDSPLSAGMKVKALVAADVADVIKIRVEKDKYEIGVRVGDGKNGPAEREKGGQADRGTKGKDSPGP